MTLEKRISLICFILVAGGLACLYPLQREMDNTFKTNRAIEESMYLSSGETVRRLSVGFDGLVADLYWIRAVQYFGLKFGGGLQGKGTFQLPTQQDLPLLYPMLDVLTTIDPDYLAAYRSGSLFISEYDFDSAIALLKKGISNARDPLTKFKLLADLGAIYWRAHRYEECAVVYEEASKTALSQRDRAWTALMVGAAKTRGGDRKTSYLLFTRLFDDAEDEAARKAAQWRLEQLQSLDDRDFLIRQVHEFQKRTGRPPQSLAQIFPLIQENVQDAKDTLGRPLWLVTQAGKRFDANRNPLDPYGTPYRYFPDKDCVGLSPESTIASEPNETCR